MRKIQLLAMSTALGLGACFVAPSMVAAAETNTKEIQVESSVSKEAASNMEATLKVTSLGYANNKVKLKASASGATGTKQYQFRAVHNFETVILKDFSTSKSYTFTETEGGDIIYEVVVKDEEGNTATAQKQVNIKKFSQEELQLRQKLVNTAVKWYGVKEKSAKHKEILKIYNNEKNNMYINGKYKHYTAKITDSWCDIFVSASFIKAGYKVISGVECGCERHIKLNKKLSTWMEDDSYVPTKGDIIFYDWQDSGKGDCKGHSDHVGIVCSVSGNKIKVIEGNKDGSPDHVGYRTVKVNQRYIRGYAIPKYSKLLEN